MSDHQAHTLRLPRDLSEEAKIVAAAAEISLNQLVVDAVRRELDRYHRDEAFRGRLTASIERHRHILDRLAAT